MHQLLNSRFGSKDQFNSNSVAALAGTNKELLEKALIPGAKEARQPIIPNIQRYQKGSMEASQGTLMAT